MTLSAVALSMVVAGAPAFSDVVKKFQPATLPLSSKAFAALPKVTLSAADLKCLAIKEHARGELAELTRWMGPKQRAFPVASVTRGEQVVLVVAASSNEGTQHFLLTYGAKGEFLDGVRFSSSVTSESGGVEEVSTLNAEGGLGRRATAKTPMHEDGLPGELVVVSEQVGKLTSKGTFELGAPEFRSRDGVFLDAATKEELRVFGEQIFYRASATEPFRRLAREGDSVRFKPEGKVYLLSWDERRKSLSCLNPDGSVQQFARVL